MASQQPRGGGTPHVAARPVVYSSQPRQADGAVAVEKREREEPVSTAPPLPLGSPPPEGSPAPPLPQGPPPSPAAALQGIPAPKRLRVDIRCVLYQPAVGDGAGRLSCCQASARLPAGQGGRAAGSLALLHSLHESLRHMRTYLIARTTPLAVAGQMPRPPTVRSCSLLPASSQLARRVSDDGSPLSACTERHSLLRCPL